MRDVDRSIWPLAPSQQKQYQTIQEALASVRGSRRPFLLTGEVGVGKTFLARRIASSDATYENIAEDHLGELLASQNLAGLTPEAVVRFLKQLVSRARGRWVILDGLEPLLSLWAVQRPVLLRSFLIPMSRVITPTPLMVVIPTSHHLPYPKLVNEHLWPSERSFRLGLTTEDREAVAQNWGLDPIRAHVSANLHELLAPTLMR